jgi:hypothetical protein
MLLVRVSVAQLPTSIVLDADIGGNIDDALALALLLSSPALDLWTVNSLWRSEGTNRLVGRIMNREKGFA